MNQAEFDRVAFKVSRNTLARYVCAGGKLMKHAGDRHRDQLETLLVYAASYLSHSGLTGAYLERMGKINLPYMREVVGGHPHLWSEKPAPHTNYVVRAAELHAWTLRLQQFILTVMRDGRLDAQEVFGEETAVEPPPPPLVI